MTQKMADYLAVGRIVGAHGIRGEVKVDVLTDFIERFEPGSELLLEQTKAVWTIETMRPHKKFLLVKFAQVRDRTQANSLRGQHLLILREQAMPLDEDEYYEDELIGLDVVSTEGRALGKVVDVWWTGGANEIYVVKGADGEVLIPAIADVVKKVDLEANKLLVELIPGLV